MNERWLHWFKKPEFPERLIERYQSIYNASRKDTIECLLILSKTMTIKQMYEEAGLIDG